MFKLRQAALAAKAGDAAPAAAPKKKKKAPSRGKSLWSKISVNSKSKARSKLKMGITLGRALRRSRANIKSRYDTELFRVVVLGVSATGKTKLCSHFTGCSSSSERIVPEDILFKSADVSSVSATKDNGFGSEYVMPSSVVISDSVIDDDSIVTVTHNSIDRRVAISSNFFEAAANVPKAQQLEDPMVKYAHKAENGLPEFLLDQPKEKDYQVYAARVNTMTHDLTRLQGLSGLTTDDDDEDVFPFFSTSTFAGSARTRAIQNNASIQMASDYGVQLVEVPDGSFLNETSRAPIGEQAELSAFSVDTDDANILWDDYAAEAEEESRELLQELTHEAVTSLGVSTTTLQEKDPRTGNDEDEEGRFGNLFLGYEFGTLTNPIARRDAKRETTDRENNQNFNPKNTLWMNCIAGAAIIMYDIRKPQTFARARELYKEILEARQSEPSHKTVPVLVLANFSDTAASSSYDFGRDEDLVTSDRAFFAHGSVARNRFVHQGQVHTVIELVHRLCTTMKSMQLFKLGPRKEDHAKHADSTGVNSGGNNLDAGAAAAASLKDDKYAVKESGSDGGKDRSSSKSGKADAKGRKNESGLGWCW